MPEPFAELSDAVRAIAAERSVEPVLEKLVHTAQRLAGARYAALGIPDGAGGFSRFIHSGLTEAEIAAIGPLPRTHGLLGAMLESTAPTRVPDIRSHPRFQWWPAAHPEMSSFLGVPVRSKGEVVAAFYLTDKAGAAEFSAEDQAAIELLAAHAAVAIENARAHELSRELSVIEERNRLARELHDSVTQRLFSLNLAAETARTLLERDPAAASEQLGRVQMLAEEAIGELRSVIVALRPARLAEEGLAATLRKHSEVLGRAHRCRIDVDAAAGAGLGDHDRDAEVLRVAQEALGNAVRHSGAERVWVRLAAGDATLTLLVGDDGAGFDPRDPELRATRLGLSSMEERAAALGGQLEIDSTPGGGTRVSLEVPR